MIIIVNDFCKDAQDVRESALAAGFGTWTPNSSLVGSGKYTGMGFMGKHAIMLHALSMHMGKPVIPNSMFFRVSNVDSERAYIHSDRSQGQWTCVCYLSEHEDEYGTGFWKHKETGLIEMPEEWMTDEAKAKEMVEGSSSKWELRDVCAGAFNKAVIFKAPLFHSRLPMTGIGTGETDGRLIWGCHFYII